VDDCNAIERNIEEYRALLRRELPRSMRTLLRQLLVEEMSKLTRAQRAKEVEAEEMLAEA
jgi:hypothetical protein